MPPDPLSNFRTLCLFCIYYYPEHCLFWPSPEQGISLHLGIWDNKLTREFWGGQHCAYFLLNALCLLDWSLVCEGMWMQIFKDNIEFWSGALDLNLVVYPCDPFLPVIILKPISACTTSPCKISEHPLCHLFETSEILYAVSTTVFLHVYWSY